ncbi:MAG TPA: SHOCT domain-containing protein [Albitalea sp.]|nr:SHOCT domain-containing protein [Albitalea sp.]
MNRIHRHTAAVAALAGTLLAAMPAQAGVMDFLFGTKKGGDAAAAAPTAVDSQRRNWRIGEFTAIQLVPREPGSAPNRQPVQLHPEGLRQQLALVRTPVKGSAQPLFSTDELNELVEPLTQALSASGPGDDVLLLSTARRGEGVLTAPMGVTARLFAEGGSLHLIVHDARRDFVNAYIGSHIAPQFDFGSRARASAVSLQSASAPNRRGDWLALPMAAAVTPSAAPLAAPSAAPLAAVAPAAAAAPASAAPSGRTRDSAFYDEQAQRLLGLKRMRDQGAITEEEYLQKRREIMSAL